MQSDKKQLEILLLDYFRSCYSDFPKGRVLPVESPDFLVKLKNKNSLGIELTRLNPVNAILPNQETKLKNEFREEWIELTKEIVERNSEITLFVKFLFSETEEITKERAISVAVRVAGLIKTLTGKYKKESFYNEYLPEKILPSGLEAVLIVHHPKLKTSVWERSNNLGISNNVVDDIHKAIHKKDEKLRLYHKNHLNLYWLLIFTDRLRGTKNFNVSNKILNQKFESRFQSVFLFDLVKSKVFKLV